MRLGAALLALFCLAACGPRFLPEAQSLASLKPGEVILVGKVELVPPLDKDEQDLDWGAGGLRGKIYLFAGDKWRDVDTTPGFGLNRELDDGIEAVLGETFFVQSPHRPFVLLLSMVILNLRAYATGPRSSAVDTDYLFFPGGLQVSVQPGDKALYLGTIRYHRDEFFETKKIEVADDFGKAQAAFQKKFGGKVSLRKSLAVPLSKPAGKKK
ncbi:MAG: hypothetical protein AB1405_15125 [Bdellovibrionota bacterium]